MAFIRLMLAPFAGVESVAKQTGNWPDLREVTRGLEPRKGELVISKTLYRAGKSECTESESGAQNGYENDQDAWSFFAARSLITCKLVQVANIDRQNDGQPLRELAGVADNFPP